jgi:hypothetical protein
MGESLESAKVVLTSEIMAVVILVLGVIVGWLARLGLDTLLNFIDRSIARFSATGISILSPGVTRFAGIFVFWVVLALAVVLSLHTLGVAGLSLITPVLLQYLPKVIFGMLIVIAGHLLGLLAKSFMMNFIPGVTTDSPAPKLIYFLFMLVAIVIAVEQIDIDLSFVTQLLLILASLIGGSLALAFGLGARQLVANLLAYRELDRLHMGDEIAIGDIQGKIVNIKETFVEISTTDGIVSVPAAWFAEKALRHIVAGDESA